jgi:hypothetical protein
LDYAKSNDTFGSYHVPAEASNCHQRTRQR